MSYRTILVDLSGPEPSAVRIALAWQLATTFGGTVVGVHVRPPPYVAPVWDGVAGAYVATDALEAESRANDERMRRALSAFEAGMKDGPPKLWRQAEGSVGIVLSEMARAADLLVIGRGDPIDVGQRIIGSGVPVLVQPDAGQPRPFERVLVAWNGTRESARALHDALPILASAREPVVLCAVGERAGASLADAAGMLQRHGVRAHPEAVEGEDASAAEILLALATAHAADLLVMGAYGHSRLRELVFGGATRHVLGHATLPLLLSS